MSSFLLAAEGSLLLGCPHLQTRQDQRRDAWEVAMASSSQLTCQEDDVRFVGLYEGRRKVK